MNRVLWFVASKFKGEYQELKETFKERYWFGFLMGWQNKKTKVERKNLSLALSSLIPVHYTCVVQFHTWLVTAYCTSSGISKILEWIVNDFFWVMYFLQKKRNCYWIFVTEWQRKQLKVLENKNQGSKIFVELVFEF